MQLASLFLSIGILGVSFIIFSSFVLSLNYLSRSIIYTLLIVITIRIITYKYGILADPSMTGSNNEMFLSTTNYNLSSEIVEEKNAEIHKKHLLLSPVENTLIVEKEIVLPHKRKEILSQSEMFKILLKLEKSMEKEQYYKEAN